MAGQKSGKAPGKTPYAPGGAEVWSDAPNEDYFSDPYFAREGSLDQTRQQWADQERLDQIKKGSMTVPARCKGGKVIKTFGR